MLEEANGRVIRAIACPIKQICVKPVSLNLKCSLEEHCHEVSEGNNRHKENRGFQHEADKHHFRYRIVVKHLLSVNLGVSFKGTFT